jgi:hypothetical protein
VDVLASKPIDAATRACDEEHDFADADVQAEERCLLVIDKKMDEVKNSMSEASQAVRAFTRVQVNEVKSIKNNPPQSVRRALEALYVVLNCRVAEVGIVGPGRITLSPRGLDSEKEWPRIQRMLSSSDFVQSVLSFDLGLLDAFPHVAEFVAAKYFPMLRKECAGELSQPASRDFAGHRDSSVPNTKSWQSSSCQHSGVNDAELRCSVYAAAQLATGTQPLACPVSTPRIISSSAVRPVATARSPRFPRPLVSPRVQAEEEHVGLDIAAVEHASRACGVLVRWVSEVLREFFLLRELRSRRRVATERRDNALSRLRASEAVKLHKLPSPPKTPPRHHTAAAAAAAIANTTPEVKQIPRWMKEFSTSCFVGLSPRLQ